MGNHKKRNGAVQVSPRFCFQTIIGIVIATSLAVVSLALVSPSAQADPIGVTWYSVRPVINPVHTYPQRGPTGNYILALPGGTRLTIYCQDYGVGVRGTNIWNLLADGSWISDYYVTTPYFNAITPQIGRCGQSSTGGLTGMQAFSRAASLIGQAWQRGGLPWAWWCDRFVANVYGVPNSGFASAIEHFRSLQARGLIHSEAHPPFGAMVFYNTPNGGHVVYSYGNDNIITTPAKNGLPVYRTTVNHFPNYVGWAYVEPNWHVT